MSGNLQAAIDAKNKETGREQQKKWAKRSYIKTTQATRAENLCCRAEELIKEVYASIASGQTRELAKAVDALELAIKIDRREREAGK